MTTTPTPRPLDGHMLSPTIRNLKDQIREVNTANGWFDDDRSAGEDRSLIHSEISEALEAYRDHGYEDMTEALCGLHLIDSEVAHLCKPEGVASEIADVLIRLLDTIDRREIQPYWLDMPLDDVIPYRVSSGRFGDWLDVMHTATAKEDHELLLRTLVGAAEFLVDVDLERETVRKIAYNETRGHKHGGKRL